MTTDLPGSLRRAPQLAHPALAAADWQARSPWRSPQQRRRLELAPESRGFQRHESGAPQPAENRESRRHWDSLQSRHAAETAAAIASLPDRTTLQPQAVPLGA